jgi:transposase-like protein
MIMPVLGNEVRGGTKKMLFALTIAGSLLLSSCAENISSAKRGDLDMKPVGVIPREYRIAHFILINILTVYGGIYYFTPKSPTKEEIMQCTHCGSFKFVKNGSYKGSQRFVCKDCNRAFSDKVRKFSYADKERFLLMYLNNVGIRKAALFMNCSSSLIVRWVREFAANIRLQLQNAPNNLQKDEIPEIIEMDEIYTRIKKGGLKPQYGLLILGTEVKLLRIS